MGRSRRLFIIFSGWMILLTIFSLVPLEGLNCAVKWDKWDKVAHFIAYFLTALLFYVSFRDRFKPIDIYAMLFAFDYGVILELVQHFIRYRVFSFIDLAANLSGVLFFFLLYKILWGKI